MPTDPAHEITLDRHEHVDVASIEKELAALWRGASADAGQANRQVTRACSWNLVVHAQEPAAFAMAAATVKAAVRTVPSRALLLHTIASDGADDVRAAVSAQCQIAPGGGKLLCTEEVTVETSGRSAAARMPSLMRAILVPDVPTTLWWAGAPPADHAACRPFLAGVDRLVLDSASVAHEGQLKRLGELASLLERTLLVDLHWLRAAPLRSLLASLFDGPGGPDALDQLARVRIRVAPGHGRVAARLMLGWLAARLRWGAPRSAGEALAVAKEGIDGEVLVTVDDHLQQAGHSSGIGGLQLETADGRVFALDDITSASVLLRMPGVEARPVSLQDLTPPQLIVAALGARARERLSSQALRRAAAFAA